MYVLAVELSRAKGALIEEQELYMLLELLTIPEKTERILEDKGRVQWFASKFANARESFLGSKAPALSVS